MRPEQWEELSAHIQGSIKITLHRNCCLFTKRSSGGTLVGNTSVVDENVQTSVFCLNVIGQSRYTLQISDVQLKEFCFMAFGFQFCYGCFTPFWITSLKKKKKLWRLAGQILEKKVKNLSHYWDSSDYCSHSIIFMFWSM